MLRVGQTNVYMFGIGDGNDVIEESAPDLRADRKNLIRLGEGIGAGDITLINDNTAGAYMDLIIRINSTGETLTIKNGLVSGSQYGANPYAIQGIEFADGTVWDWEEILRQPMYMKDSVGIYGQYTAYEGSTLIGNKNANALNGRENSDILYGNGGSDTLNGNGGNDVLSGGAGNDTLNGGAGDDIYLFQAGDGTDTLTESSGNDKLFFGTGIDLDDIWFARSGSDLVIDILGSKDRVNIKNWFSNASYQVDSIAVGDMEIVNTQMNQLLQAMAGFGVPQGVDGRFTEEQKEAMAPVLSTYWRPTGS